MGAIVELQGIRKSYGVDTPVATEVLHGIDARLDEGEFVALVGPSGSGKSTLLNIIGLLERPTAGRLAIAGRDTAGLDEAGLTALRGRAIGFVFQFHHLLAEFTALENVMLPLLIAGEKPKAAEAAARDYLGFVGLAERVRHKPGELSGGEAQRVAIARALVRRPDVVFADEPTGNLDTRTSDEIHRLLVELNARLGTAFVVVTHNVKLAWMLARHLLLADGVVRELRNDEAPEEFLPKREHGQAR